MNNVDRSGPPKVQAVTCRAPTAIFSATWPCSSSPSTWCRSEEHTSELQSRGHLVCRLLLEKKKKNNEYYYHIININNRNQREQDKNRCYICMNVVSVRC